MLDGTTASPTFASARPLPHTFETDVLRATEVAMDFDLSHILARYRKEQSLPASIIADHHRELMRYLAMSAVGLHHQRYYGMLGAVDELWHTFVIFTREYAAFCDRVAGQFMHHVPVVERQASDGKINTYVLFLTDYQAIFAETAPSVYWPQLGRLPDQATCGVDDDPGCSVGCSVACGCGTGPVV